MKWRLRDLDLGNREKLAAVFRDRGLPGALCYFEDRRRGKVIGWTGCGALVLGAVGVEILWENLSRPHAMPVVVAALLGGLTTLLLLWGSLALWESFRTRHSAIRPFLLITPEFVLHCDEPYGIVHGYRLAEATGFRAAEKHNSYQRYVGREYDLAFAEEHVLLLAKTRQRIDLAEQVFAAARASRAPRSEFLEGFPIPDAAVKSSKLRELTHPFGVFWQGLGGILLIGLFVLFVADRIFRWSR